MKIVIDSNQLQSDNLRMYLGKSKSNLAVLTDYAAMEAYKGDTLASIYNSMAILCDFPTQVIVLKGTRVACGLKGRAARLQRRFIDEAQTASFPKYTRQLRQAKNGNHGIQQQLLNHGREATAHLDRMLNDAQTTGAVIDDIAKLYSKEERQTVYLGQAYSSSMVDKTVRNILYVAATAFRDHPSTHETPRYDELVNTFIFRVALCTYLLVLDRAACGGGKNVAPAKLRNDLVDMNFVAYATYFDGLMTADARMLRIHTEARIWLMALFGLELPSEYCRIA